MMVWGSKNDSSSSVIRKNDGNKRKGLKSITDVVDSVILKKLFYSICATYL
jgi:hypothetical protein